MRRRLPGFGEEGGEGIVESSLDGRYRRLFVDDAGGEGFPGFSEGFQGCEDIGIGGGGLRGTEFRDGKGDGGKELRMEADEFGSEADVEERTVRRERTRVLVFVAMGGVEIAAPGWAVERDLTFGTTTDGADFFGFGRTESFGLAFLTDRTEHGIP